MTAVERVQEFYEDVGGRYVDRQVSGRHEDMGSAVARVEAVG